MKNIILLSIAYLFIGTGFIFSCNSKINSNPLKSDFPSYGKDSISYAQLDVQRDSINRTLTFKIKDQLYTGTVIQKFEDNQRTFIWTVENGKASYQLSTYRNGDVERTLEMKDGVEHGAFLMYYPNGLKYVEQHFENGKPVGTWYQWTKQGLLVKTIEH